MSVVHLMVGGVTPAGAVVAAKLTDAVGTSCKLVVSLSNTFSDVIEGPAAVADSDHRVLLDAPRLTPDTQYWYRVKIGGSIDTASTGKFRSAPTAPGASFTIAAINCSANSPAGLAAQKAVSSFLSTWSQDDYCRSDSSVVVGTGTKVFTGVGTGLLFVPGMVVQATNRAATSPWMRGIVSSYTSASGGTLTLAVPANFPTSSGGTAPSTAGSGTVSAWKFKFGPIAGDEVGFPVGTFTGEAQGGITGPSNSSTGQWPSAANSVAYDNMRSRNLAFCIHLGDWGYSNVSTPDYATGLSFRRWFHDLQFVSPRKKQFLAEVPMVYTWDDHDYGPDNAMGNSPSGESASAWYDQCIPHYPYAITGPTLTEQNEWASAGLPLRPGSSIAQSVSWGKVRVLLLDSRKFRVRGAALGDTHKTMLGQRQRQWLFDQLDAFEADTSSGVLILVSSSVWQSAKGRSDTWGDFNYERRIIADYLQGHVSKQVIMLCGDSHMIGLDDGVKVSTYKSTDYTTNSLGYKHPMVLAQTGVMGRELADHNSQMCFGGSISGTKDSTSQTSYTLLTFTDNGDDTMTVKIECFAMNQTTGAETATVHTPYTWTVSTKSSTPGGGGGGGGTDPLIVITTTLPNSIKNQAYPNTPLRASGGTGTYTWTKASGTLPPGLQLASGGIITGTPTAAGTYTFTMQCVSGVQSRSQAYTVIVRDVTPPPPPPPPPTTGFARIVDSLGRAATVVDKRGRKRDIGVR